MDTASSQSMANFEHIQEVCENENCEPKNCKQRHPKDCKFAEICTFNHKIEGRKSDAEEIPEKEVDKKVSKLENTIRSMESEIKQHKAKVLYLESISLKVVLETTSEADSDIEETASEPEIFEGFEENESEVKETFKCDHCDFLTEKKSGLKIHVGKKHKNYIMNPSYDNFGAKKSSEGYCYQVCITKSKRNIIFIHDM